MNASHYWGKWINGIYGRSNPIQPIFHRTRTHLVPLIRPHFLPNALAHFLLAGNIAILHFINPSFCHINSQIHQVAFDLKFAANLFLNFTKINQKMYQQYQNFEIENNLPELPLKVPMILSKAKNGEKLVPSPTDSPSPMPHSASDYSSKRPSTAQIGGECSPSTTDSMSSSVTIQNEVGTKGNENMIAPKEDGPDGEFSDELGIEEGELDENMPKGDALLNIGMLGPMQLARAHWIQLHKMDMQMPILRRMFLQLLEHNPQLRALWPFARQFDGTNARLQQMVQGNSFRHFCQSYQATFTLLMDNLDDEPALCRLLQEFGSNHFFYDAMESHFRMMRIEFLNALVDCLAGSKEELDEELAEDWEKFWSKLESNMGFGLKVQRHNYLAHCFTGGEMALIREQWIKLLDGGGRIDKLVQRINANGIQNFLNGLESIGLVAENQSIFVTLFTQACRELLWAMEKALTLWEPGTGFLRLCAEIDGKCSGANELIRMASAPMLRRPFMESFSLELTKIVGNEKKKKESSKIGLNKKGKLRENEEEKNALLLGSIHGWTKIYRVAEQAIIADELDNARNRGAEK